MKQGSFAKWMYTLLTALDYGVAVLVLLISMLLKLLAIPLNLFKLFRGIEITQKSDPTEVNLINMAREWVSNHQNDIAEATESFDTKDSYFAKIVPKNEEAATLNIEIGYPKYLRISIENFGIEFNEDVLDDSGKIFQEILWAYENGDYYIKNWDFKGHMIDKTLVMRGSQGAQYSSKSDELKLLRKLFAKVKLKKFQPIAA
jgi:hypothetical protein